MITRSEQGMQALGQLVRFMVAWTHNMFALPFMGAEAFIFFLMIYFQYTASLVFVSHYLTQSAN